MKAVQRVRKNPRKTGIVTHRTGAEVAELQQYDVERVVAALETVWERFQRAEKAARVSPEQRRIPHTV